MLTVVLDDDPTGTQCATDVPVLLEWDATAIAAALRSSGAVYLQTNSRAVSPEQARREARLVRDQIATVRRDLGQPVLVVLRGDSTLRGHVFAESDVFAEGGAPILFVPAFPAAGRTTVGSVHRAMVDGVDTPVGETEFARDPVFGFRSSHLVEWTRELGQRQAHQVPLAQLRATAGQAVAEALADAGPRELVVPDVATDNDVHLVHNGLLTAIQAGQPVVVRAAAPLAAVCAGRLSTGYLPRPLPIDRRGVLVVCGSHTAAATAQLNRLAAWLAIDPVLIDTDAAFADAQSAGRAAADRARPTLMEAGVAVVASARDRRPADDTLAHGATVMNALIEAASALRPMVGAVVSKGGITSAEVARTCFGARSAHVRGQVAPGISLWELGDEGHQAVQVIVPGNVGGPETLVDVLQALGIDQEAGP